ncbi:hypothetical protein ABBQ38_009073 [Trebouxia sp. C0009 RCD-2024]
MKFGALLRNSAAELPELHQLFVSYKQLKKRLKRLPERQELVRQRERVAGGELPDVDVRELRQQEEAFVQVLDQDVQHFNSLFLDKEEDNVIRLSSLEDDAAAADTPEQVHAVYKRFVNFHGELLLMVHWSILAYTGLVKILKKHHKRTGLLVRAPHLDNLLSQPFCSVELTTNLIKKAEEGVNGLMAKLGAPADLSQHSPHASVQQLLHATKSLTELNAGSALGHLQDGSVELATSSDEDDAANPPIDSLTAGNGDANSGAARPPTHRKRYRVDEPNDDPDQATSARVRHSDHQHPVAFTAPASTPASDSSRPMSEAAAAAVIEKSQARPITHVVAHAAHRVAPTCAAGQVASNTSAQQGRASSSALRPPATGSGPTVSVSSQQGDCIGPDGTFVGRAAAAGLPPNIMQQTRAALGLWEQLHETASTPSTVLAPVNRHGPAIRTVSVGTDNSAA